MEVSHFFRNEKNSKDRQHTNFGKYRMQASKASQASRTASPFGLQYTQDMLKSAHDTC